MSEKDATKLIQYYKDQYKLVKQNGYTRSSNSFIKEMEWGEGLGLDVTGE